MYREDPNFDYGNGTATTQQEGLVFVPVLEATAKFT